MRRLQYSASEKWREIFIFTSNDNRLFDANPSATDIGSPNVPGFRVRKQTRDIVRIMQWAQQVKSHYYLFMEDDFQMCSRTLSLLSYYTDKASRQHGAEGWLSLKVSYGMNGFLLRNDVDLLTFGEYLLEHQARRPPDHLQTEWSCGEKQQSALYKNQRPHLVSRYNLFSHLGLNSSLRSEKSPNYPICYHEMNTEVVFEVESFKIKECPNDDLWPCPKSVDVNSYSYETNDVRIDTSLLLETYNIPQEEIGAAQKT